MKLTIRWCAMLTAALAAICVSGAYAQQAAPAGNAAVTATAPPSALQKSVEAYLRHVYAFGPDIKVTVGAPKETNVPGLLETSIDVKIEDNVQSVKFYVSKDGNYLLRGELSDLRQDPLAEARAKMDLKNAPSMGDPQAAVTIVEYSDFECPVCRGLHEVLRGMLPNYPQVRVVFKDFPIEQIHPWARTAAIAGRCAYQQDPKAFWKLYDLIYDNQEIISAENAWSKMVEYAGQIKLDSDALKSCMAAPEAAAAVDASKANGLQLEVNSTPTIFVNGRRLVGGDPHALEQFIQYEINQRKNKTTP